jgi:hypothetical protein
MKRSEFVTRHTQGGTPNDRAEAEMAANLSEEAARDLLRRIARTDIAEVWDPEEPELPERVVPVRFCGTCLSLDPAEGLPGGTAEHEARVREAAARYNAVGRLLDGPRGLIHVDHIERTLRLERARL